MTCSPCSNKLFSLVAACVLLAACETRPEPAGPHSAGDVQSLDVGWSGDVGNLEPEIRPQEVRLLPEIVDVQLTGPEKAGEIPDQPGPEAMEEAEVLAADRWSVITINLHCHHDQPELRLQQVANLAMEVEADVLALQEVCQGGGLTNTAQTLASLLSEQSNDSYGHVFEGTHLAWDTYDEGIGFVYRGELADQQIALLPPGLFPRKALWLGLNTPKGRLDTVVTHLSFGQDQADVRLAQAQALEAFVSDVVTAAATGTVALCGDFNDSPDSASMQGLFDSGWTDTFMLLNPGKAGKTYPAGNPKSKIDYLMVRDNTYETVDSADIVFDKPDRGLYVSDHYGLAALITP